ncbi:MAG: peptide deformylase [Deltaproteobacteria bacterium]|nr:MAG: peptide deformylase [Deltaproteobacteria bacterium]
MAILPIVHWPHRALSTPAAPVEAFDGSLHRLIDDMAETMYAASGVGLAANQVDRLHRVTVMDCAAEDEPSQLLEIVNPEIVGREGTLVWEEGCLSFPGLYNEVKRAARVTVRYRDRNGEACEITGEGLLAVCLQHEIDHLDGVVFIDRLGPLGRRMALKQWKKIEDELARGGVAPGRRSGA